MSARKAGRIVAADTSFLFSLLGKDFNTDEALAVVGELSESLTLSPVNDLELINASLMAEFQGFKAPGFSARMETMLKAEHAAGRFRYPPFNPAKAIARATELSRRHTLTQGHRTYDVLLVAAAIELGATDFLTFDARQARLAEAEGLVLWGVALG